LHKARSEFEKRIEQGEDIQFNFSFKNAKSELEAHQLSEIECCSASAYQPEDACSPNGHAFKKRRLSKYTGSPSEEACGTSNTKSTLVHVEEERVLINYNNFFQVQSNNQHEMPIKPVTNSPSVSPTSELMQATPQKKTRGKRSNSGAGQANAAGNGAQGVQSECCLIGCHNTVTNRLRFSLRCHKHEDFKQEFLDNGWNKVCHYHYFSDLYKYKKMTHGSAKVGGRKSKSASPSPAASPVHSPVELDAPVQVSSVIDSNTSVVVPSAVLGKRLRSKVQEEEQDNNMINLQKATDQRLEDANVFVHFLMTTKNSPGGDL